MPAYHFAVLGDPVSHSRSPAIHNVMLELAGLDGEYGALRADEDVLTVAIADLRQGRWHGLNVTMPLKRAAARLADVLSPQAKRSGSVNTLLMERSAVYGDSTDSTTFRQLVGNPEFSGCSSVLVLGAGGSASAALAALDVPQHVYVAARRPSQAVEVTSHLVGEPIAWGTAVAGALVINTTPIGMEGETLPTGILDVAGGLIDLPYGPTPTPSIAAADALGLPRVDGHEFLVRQAMASFAMWTGRSVDYTQVVSSLKKL
jgi:shikimate dehydrogenase